MATLTASADWSGTTPTLPANFTKTATDIRGAEKIYLNGSGIVLTLPNDGRIRLETGSLQADGNTCRFKAKDPLTGGLTFDILAVPSQFADANQATFECKTLTFNYYDSARADTICYYSNLVGVSELTINANVCTAAQFLKINGTGFDTLSKISYGLHPDSTAGIRVNQTNNKTITGLVSPKRATGGAALTYITQDSPNTLFLKDTQVLDTTYGMSFESQGGVTSTKLTTWKVKLWDTMYPNETVAGTHGNMFLGNWFVQALDNPGWLLDYRTIKTPTTKALDNTYSIRVFGKKFLQPATFPATGTATQDMFMDATSSVLVNEAWGTAFTEQVKAGVTAKGYELYIRTNTATNGIMSGTGNNPHHVVLRKPGKNEYVLFNNALIPATNIAVTTDNFTIDANFVASYTNAGVVYSYSGGNLSIAVSVNCTSQNLWDGFRTWYAQTAQMGATLVPENIMTKDASGNLKITGSLTTSATISAGGNFTVGIVATGTITTTGTEGVNMPTTDSTGTTIQINNVNPNTFTLDATYPASLLYRTTGSTTYTVVSSATASALKFTAIPSTNYDIVMLVPGYDIRSFTVNSRINGVSQSANMVPTLGLDGVPLFTLIGDAIQIAAISYNSTTHKIDITNTSGAELDISFISGYIKFTQLLHAPDIVGNEVNHMYVNPTRTGWLIPAGDQTVVQLTDTSTANVFMQFTVQEAATLANSFGRFKGNSAGFQLCVASTVNNLTIPVPTADQNAAATKTAIETTTVLAKVDTKMTLATAYDAAKTAAQAGDAMALTTTATTAIKTSIEGSTILATNNGLNTVVGQIGAM